MSFEINKKLRSYCSWLIIFSIINLFILSLIPLVSIVENGSNGELYFNGIMMDRSEDSQIQNIANYLFFIIELLWIVIILNSISYLSFSIYFSEKFPRFSKIMINTSFINLVINVLIFYLQINLIKKIVEIDNLSLASAFSFIKFAYIPLIIRFLLLIFSIMYALYVILNVIKEKKYLTIGEKPPDRKLISRPKKIDKRESFHEKIISDYNVDIKNIRSRELLESEKEQKLDLKIESEPGSSETNKFVEKKKNFENEQDDKLKFIKSKDKINSEPFPVEKPKERPKESGEIPISQQFEKALSSAVEKKYTEKKGHVPLETKFENKHEKINITEPQTDLKLENPEDLVNDENKEIKKKIKVKCPQCKFVFPVEKKGNITSVKCPNCGKEGVIKFSNEILKYPPLS